MHSAYDQLYSFKLQKGQMSATNQHFSGNSHPFSIKTGEQKGVVTVVRKVLQNFEEHGNWHCKLITFSVIYNFGQFSN